MNMLRNTRHKAMCPEVGVVYDREIMHWLACGHIDHLEMSYIANAPAQVPLLPERMPDWNCRRAE